MRIYIMPLQPSAEIDETFALNVGTPIGAPWQPTFSDLALAQPNVDDGSEPEHNGAGEAEIESQGARVNQASDAPHENEVQDSLTLLAQQLDAIGGTISNLPLGGEDLVDFQKRGLHLHRKLMEWLGSYQSPRNGRTCFCPGLRTYLYQECRHLACDECVEMTGQCCNLRQGCFLVSLPDEGHCIKCNVQKYLAVFLCGHTLCGDCLNGLDDRRCPTCNAEVVII